MFLYQTSPADWLCVRENWGDAFQKPSTDEFEEMKSHENDTDTTLYDSSTWIRIEWFYDAIKFFHTDAIVQPFEFKYQFDLFGAHSFHMDKNNEMLFYYFAQFGDSFRMKCVDFSNAQKSTSNRFVECTT